MKLFVKSALLVAALAVPSLLSAAELKGLNVLMTSPDAQTQMMGMVLGGSVLNDQKKALNITLCGPAGNLALKDFTADINAVAWRCVVQTVFVCLCLPLEHGWCARKYIICNQVFPCNYDYNTCRSDILLYATIDYAILCHIYRLR